MLNLEFKGLILKGAKVLTIKEVLKNTSTIDEHVLCIISDELWGMGDLEYLQRKLSPDLFLLHVGMNAVGVWKSDGWWSVISENSQLVPFIPEALKAFGLDDLRVAFEELISAFPEYTDFSCNDSQTYCDIVNFLQNIRFKVSDKRLNAVSPEKRKELVSFVREKLSALEDITNPLWSFEAPNGGWKHVIDFASSKI